MKSYVKKLSQNAKIPSRAHESDVGYDVWAIDYKIGLLDSFHNYRPQVTLFTGLSIKPPRGHYWELLPRSSVSKSLLMLANSVGIIDPDYTGELMFKFNFASSPKYFPNLHASHLSSIRTASESVENYMRNFIIPEEGKFWKVGQLVLRKKLSCEIVELNELPETERGSGGFGSTGN